MSGDELLRRVKLQSPDTVRVVITAYSDLDPILRAVNEGLVHRYIIKPWDRAELEQILLWALEAYALGRESSALQLRLMQTERLVTLGSIYSAIMHDLKQPLSHMSLHVQRLEQFAAAMPALVELIKRSGPEIKAAERALLEDLTSELPAVVPDLLSSVAVMKELTGAMKQFLQPVDRAPAEAPSTDPVPVIRYAISVCRETAVRAQGRLIYDGPAELPRV